MLRLELEKRRVDNTVLSAFKKALELARLYSMSAGSEWEGLLRGLAGGYIEPGAAGALPRGKMEILPTGRNFYATDPLSLPTPAAWKVGVESAKRLLEETKRKLGKYPESVGEILWSIDGFKADGEQLARILYMLGVKPVWDSGGRVVGVEVIPLEELGRPRIDVVVRISGIVRDTLYRFVELIDEAVEKVIGLDEPPEMNYPKKHYLETLEKLLREGVGGEEAKEAARARVWGAPPGAYGAGVNYAVFASAWRNEEDLASVWLQWSSYMYTRRGFGRGGEHAAKALILHVSRVDVVARNHVSDEHDPTNCCCYFAYQGGFHALVKNIRGIEPLNVVVDTRDPSRPRIREISEELTRIAYSKLLNSRWIEAMKKHGYRGAAEMMKKIQNLYGWQATTRALPDAVWDRIAEKYVLDEGMRRWFMENNPYALEEISRRLLEAARRGLWRPSPSVLEALEAVREEVEAALEGEVNGEVQGGEVWIYTVEDVESWRENASAALKALRWVKQGIKR